MMMTMTMRKETVSQSVHLSTARVRKKMIEIQSKNHNILELAISMMIDGRKFYSFAVWID